MAVQAADLHLASVQVKTAFFKDCLAEAEYILPVVKKCSVRIEQLGFHLIKRGVFNVPQLHIAGKEGKLGIVLSLGKYHAPGCNDLLGVLPGEGLNKLLPLCLAGQFDLREDLGLLAAKDLLPVLRSNIAVSDPRRDIEILYMILLLDLQINIAVDAAVGHVVDHKTEGRNV